MLLCQAADKIRQTLLSLHLHLMAFAVFPMWLCWDSPPPLLLEVRIELAAALLQESV